MVNLGYCCINKTLREKGIFSGRTCRKKTFESKGLKCVGELAEQNLRDLRAIIKWNSERGIHNFRMGSGIFPWHSEYNIFDLPNIQTIQNLLISIGVLSKEAEQRLSFHPGPFNVLGSPNEELVEKTILEINNHSQVMDLMGLEQSTFYPINIHCNGVYGDKNKTLARWVSNYRKLSSSARLRIVVENDDKESMYSVRDLYKGIFCEIGIPITFDYHHHNLHPDGYSEEEAFLLAYQTWLTKPLFHYSSSKRNNEDATSRKQAHADYIYEEIDTYNCNVDIDLEAKAKELALIDYINKNFENGIAKK